jgi:hypothetical protein
MGDNGETRPPILRKNQKHERMENTTLPKDLEDLASYGLLIAGNTAEFLETWITVGQENHPSCFPSAASLNR